jgi:hypothetical protein
MTTQHQGEQAAAVKDEQLRGYRVDNRGSALG